MHGKVWLVGLYFLGFLYFIFFFFFSLRSDGFTIIFVLGSLFVWFLNFAFQRLQNELTLFAILESPSHAILSAQEKN